MVLLAVIIMVYVCSTAHWALAVASFQRLIDDPGEALGPSPISTIIGVTALGLNVSHII